MKNRENKRKGQGQSARECVANQDLREEEFDIKEYNSWEKGTWRRLLAAKEEIVIYGGHDQQARPAHAPAALLTLSLGWRLTSVACHFERNRGNKSEKKGIRTQWRSQSSRLPLKVVRLPKRDASEDLIFFSFFLPLWSVCGNMNRIPQRARKSALGRWPRASGVVHNPAPSGPLAFVPRLSPQAASYVFLSVFSFEKLQWCYLIALFERLVSQPRVCFILHFEIGLFPKCFVFLVKPSLRFSG